ncbi:DUF533 domain-containing protein [Clostridium sp.]|uniref:DUF533 domain-containing protein n=1 Tax=Clostridium sp. TaxID=1506 RepID=UPI002FC99EBC
MQINEILKTETAKRNFLMGLVFLAKVDGVVDETERTFFLNAASSLQLSSESVNEINSCWNKEVMPEINFDNKEEKLFFILQAVQLCSVDGGYTEKERLFIHELAKKLGLKSDSVEKIEAWVERGIQWQAEGNQLLKMEA